MPDFNLLFHITQSQTSFLNKLLEIFSMVAMSAIMLKSLYHYSRSRDVRYAVIVTGMLLSIFFNAFHIMINYSVGIDLLKRHGILLPSYPIFILILRNIFLSGSFIISLIINNELPLLQKGRFLKVLSAGFLITAMLVMIHLVSAKLFGNYYRYFIAVLYQSLAIIQSSIWLLAAIVFADKRNTADKPVFTPLTAGFIMIGISQFVFLSDQYYMLGVNNDVTVHFLRLLGLLLIAFSVGQISDDDFYYTLRQKIVVTFFSIFILAYSSFIIVSSFIFNAKFSASAALIFFEIMIFCLIVSYSLITLFFAPLHNLISEAHKADLANSVESITIKNKDEFTALALIINGQRTALLGMYKTLEEKQNQIKHLYQSLLFQTKRSDILKKIIESVRMSFDLNKVMDTICKGLAELFGAQVVAIVEFADKNDLSSWVSRNYYEDAKYQGAYKEIINKFENEHKKQAEFVVNALWKYGVYSINNIEEADAPVYFRGALDESGIKSAIYVLIKDTENRQWGAITILKYDSYKDWGEEDKILMEIVADQIFLFMKQAQLYEDIKRRYNRELVVKSILSEISRYADINEVLKSICNQLSLLINVERVTIVQLPDNDDNNHYEIKEEYKKTHEIKGIDDIAGSSRVVDYFMQNIFANHALMAINDIQHSSLPDFVQEFYKEMGVKSIIVGPIYGTSSNWGYFALASYKDFRVWTTEDMALLELIADQIYSAITQAELFTKIKTQIERENILRDIITVMHASMDLNKIKRTLVNTLCDYFGADRVFFSEYDSATHTFLPVDKNSEAVKDKDQKSFIGACLQSDDMVYFTDLLMKRKEINFSNLDTYLQEESLAGTAFESLFRHCDIKSGYNILVTNRDSVLGFFCIDYISKYHKIKEEEAEFLRIIAYQTGIALYQAKLYMQLAENANRERLFRDITSTIRESFDVDEIKKRVVFQIGNALGADRVVIHQRDLKSGGFYPIDADSEYLTGLEIYSYRGINLAEPQYEYFYRTFMEKAEIIAPYWDKYIESSNELSLIYKDHLKPFGIKSGYIFPIEHAGDLLAVLYINFVKDIRVLSQDEVNGLRVLTGQIGVAISQATLYKEAQKKAEQERILSEIIREMKLAQDIQQAYKVLLSRLCLIFSADRAVFIDYQSILSGRTYIKYEYINDADSLSLKNIEIPENFSKFLLNQTEGLGGFNIPNIHTVFNEDTTIVEFFKEYKINSIIGMPIVKVNRTTQELGVLFVSSQSINKWTEEDIEFLNRAIASVVTVIWEITKFIEIEELRNVFMKTLANDLQIPLLEERKNIDYILSKPLEQPIGRIRDKLEDMRRLNLDIIDSLQILIDTYKYEAGLKKPDMRDVRINSIIQNSLNEAKSAIMAKALKVNMDICPDVFNIKADRGEMIRIINILVDNSILSAVTGGSISVSCFYEQKDVVILFAFTCVDDIKTLRERLVKRPEISVLKDSKVKSGMGLYLVKLIVEAHKGTVWVEKDKGNEIVIGFSIPQV